MSSDQYDEALAKLKAAIGAFQRWQRTGTARAFLDWVAEELTSRARKEECPVCSWPKHPTRASSARYGAPDAEDERSVSDSPYLHALADVVRLGGIARVALCEEHERELDEIIERDRTGRHPKREA